VNTGKLAPEGWHVPTDSEWTELENYLIANGYNSDGAREGNKIVQSLAAKPTRKIEGGFCTVSYDLSKSNSSGFSAFLGGSRYRDGVFIYLDIYGYWWTASENDEPSAWSRFFVFDNVDLIRSSLYKSFGSSVRLVKDF
jgi:uncharacterized protein (TIGR02145 family)